MYRKTKIVCAAVFAALVVNGAVATVEAQGLGRLGRAVKDRGGGAPAQDATQTQPTSSGSQSSSGSRGSRDPAAGFSAAQLDAFAAGLALEAERRSELAAALRALEPRPDYEQCRVAFSMSPDGQAAFGRYTDAVTAYFADTEKAAGREAMEAAQRTFEATLGKACGPSPDDAPRLRQERQAEPARAGAERAGMDAMNYARLREIVLPFCSAADGLEAGREAKIPSGAGRSYTYSAEDTALLKPRCARLLPLLQATQ